MNSAAISSNRKTPAQVQEDQYAEAYHYLPEISGQRFRQHRYWSWGYRYLGRLAIVFDLMKELEFDSLLDIGCGDGRFLKELEVTYKGKLLRGIDNSERAIALAKKWNPGADYRCLDMLDSPPDEQFDVATLLEVLEHIPPPALPEFVTATAMRIKPGGALIVTVPHKNEKPIEKHYQHFDASSLGALLSNEFTVSRVVPFDSITPMMKLFSKMMGGSGRYFIITDQKLNKLFYNYYLKHCLYVDRPDQCTRVAALAFKR